MLLDTKKWGHWSCALGNCRQPAIYILIRRVMKRKKECVRYTGACDSCASSYTRKIGPVEIV
jgi:hypothetical protein